MQGWNAYRDALLGCVGEYAKSGPDVMRGVQILDGGAAKTGRLEAKVHVRLVAALVLRNLLRS